MYHYYSHFPEEKANVEIVEVINARLNSEWLSSRAKILDPRDLMPSPMLIITLLLSVTISTTYWDTFIMSHIFFMHIISLAILNNHRKSICMYMCIYGCMQIKKCVCICMCL